MQNLEEVLGQKVDVVNENDNLGGGIKPLRSRHFKRLVSNRETR